MYLIPMPPRRVFTILLSLLFFFLSSFVFTPSLFGAEKISEILEHWLAVESALYNWQGSSAGDAADGETEKLFSSLEQFNKILEDFTGSLLFRQYEGTGHLPEESGIITVGMTRKLIDSVKIIAIAERSGALPFPNSLAVKTALARETDAIRQKLYSWSSIDS